MALKIRLRRMGRKKAPHYRIVVAESSMPRDGRFVANLGHYNPRTEPVTLVVDREKALSWLSKGAMPTDTARSLLRRAGVFQPEAEVATPVEVVAETARKVTKTAKKAAAKVAEVVEDAVEAVTGGEEPAAEAEAEAEAPAEAEAEA